MDLILWDLDGTLIDSKRDITNSVHYTLKTLGLPQISDELIYSFVGNGVTPLIQQSVSQPGGPTFKEALEIFMKHYDDHCLDTTLSFPGILKVLNQLSQPMVVITNKSQGFSEKIIRGLGLDRYFKGIYGGDTSFPKKPDPTIVYHLLEKFGASPKKTVIIGDSRVDMETGKNAGILTCGVTYGFRPRSELEEVGCDYLAETPENLAEVLNKHLKI
ncbi:MAG: HAD family hydrolase [Deltaproteobacteria bacterium]|nr:HAD family hydrolase [Deltaproteobacteria bacterium]